MWARAAACVALALVSLAMYVGTTMSSPLRTPPESSLSAPAAALRDGPAARAGPRAGLFRGLCAGTSCETCVGETHMLGNCRWCEMTRSCHPIGSPLDTCVTALHTAGWLCGSKAYPFQMQSFLSGEYQAAAKLLASVKELIGGKDVPFPLLPHGQTARYDAATGQMLPAGARPPAAGRPVRIGIASDWGAGTRESAAVAALLSAFGSDHTVHMGDTYYTGDEQSYRTNFFGEAAWAGGVGVRFPAGRLGVWPLVGNHEMLARGRGYYNYARHRAGPIVEGKAAGMAASYASLETEDWRVVLLDDSYSSYPSGVASAVLSSLDLGTNCSLPPSQLAWLRAVLADPSDGRGVILLGHHNYRHAFGSSCADHAKQLAQIVPRGRELVWLYGHVHSFQMHNLLPPTPQAPIAAWARCVGHGGFTQEAAPLRADPLKFDARSAQAVDRRVYRTIPIASLTGTQDVDVVANGYATLELDGSTAAFKYYTHACDGDCTEGGPSFTQAVLLAEEVFVADGAGNAKLVEQHLTDALHRFGNEPEL